MKTRLYVNSWRTYHNLKLKFCTRTMRAPGLKWIKSCMSLLDLKWGFGQILRSHGKSSNFPIIPKESSSMQLSIQCHCSHNCCYVDLIDLHGNYVQTLGTFLSLRYPYSPICTTQDSQAKTYISCWKGPNAWLKATNHKTEGQ
jgi:hypothetical protein